MMLASGNIKMPIAVHGGKGPIYTCMYKNKNVSTETVEMVEFNTKATLYAVKSIIKLQARICISFQP